MNLRGLDNIVGILSAYLRVSRVPNNFSTLVYVWDKDCVTGYRAPVGASFPVDKHTNTRWEFQINSDRGGPSQGTETVKSGQKVHDFGQIAYSKSWTYT